MKKKSKIYKLISSFLSIVLMLSIYYAPIRASENPSKIVVLDNGYEIGYGIATDWIKFIDCDGQTALLKGAVTSDNLYSLTLEKSNQIKQYPVGHVDYEKYVYDLLHPQNVIPHAANPDMIVPYGSEITGSQYKHVRIASATVELSTEDLTALGFIGVNAVLDLFQSKLGLPATITLRVIAGAADRLSDVPERMKVTTVTYEVMIKDHKGKYSYYTHCYHVQYLSYFDDGSVVGYNDYIQAVGG